MSKADAPQPGFAGYVVEVESYTTLRAAVYVTASRLLRYGALALVEDVAHRKRYLALVEDVAEKTPIPHIDVGALEALYQALRRGGAKYQDINKVLQSLMSPTTGLIKWHSIKTLKLRLLGEIAGGGLQLPERPPSPMSIVREPDHGLLAALVSRGLGQEGLYLGELAYNPGVEVRLDPSKLNTHLAVIGQTGAGKSETVKRLAAEYSWRKHLFSAGGGVLVLDVSGEYTGHPYVKPGTVPLLDAALEPDLFTTVDPKWLHGAPKTILVPYSLAAIPLHRRAEEKYAEQIGMFAKKIQERHRNTPVKALVYGRHSIYLMDARGGWKPHPVGRAVAARLLSSSENLLVVAAPLPDSVNVEQAYELSATQSTYFIPAVTEAADVLGVHDVGGLVSLTALTHLAETMNIIYERRAEGDTDAERISNAANKLALLLKTLAGRINEAASKEGRATNTAKIIVSTVAPYIEPRSHAAGKDKNGRSRGEGGRARERSFFVNTRAWLNLLAAPILRDEPGADLMDPGVVARALAEEYPVPGIRWSEYLARYAPVAMEKLFSLPKQSTRSILHALSRVSRMVSPFLDAGQYRLLARRLHRGFTIVQLAPPSRGDTSIHVARLLDELFVTAVEGYDPRNRTLIVVEEAHNLAPSSGDKASKKALLRIAREGRKWGLSLVLVTQRPGFVDPDILSQAASLIALRITNPDDLSGLKRSVESVSQEVVERLPDLDPGQALVSGPALPERRIPLLARVEKLKPRQLQQGGTG